MLKFALCATTAMAALIASPALAQDSSPNVYAGVQAGYHHLDEIDFNEVGFAATTDIDSPVYGGFAGVTLPTEGNMVLGIEGNFLLGSDAIDQEYGVSGIIGTRVGANSRVYARGGYQWVDLDVEKIADEAADDLGLSGGERALFVEAVEAGVDGEDVGDGFLLGLGADFGIGDAAFVRANIDTVEFDTVKVTGGVGLRF